MRHPVVEEDLAAIAASGLDWPRLAGRTVLVTGATGLIGGYVVEALLYRNELALGAPIRVLALARDAERAGERFAHYSGRGDLALLVQDVVEPVRTDGPIDFIVHAASLATPRAFGGDPVGTYLPNTFGTHHLLALAARKGAQGFLFVSSGAVYGAFAGGGAIRETSYGALDPLDPGACYAEAKRMGETMCAAWHRQHGVPARVARLGHSYGPHMSRRDDRAFAEFVFCVVDGRDILLNSDGQARRMFCYVGDATLGLLRVLLDGRSGEAYTVANPQAESSILDLATLVTGLYPERGSRVRLNAAPRPANYLPNTDAGPTVDISKIRALGWEPATGLVAGFRRTIASYL